MSDRDEIHAKQRGEDKSSWGKTKPLARPTKAEIEAGAPGALKVAPQYLSPDVKAISAQAAEFPHQGMFAGEGERSWGEDPECKTEKPSL